jgi:HK97 family phage prohead protease
MMETKQLSLDVLDLKFIDSNLTFSGYASIFGGIDAYGDTIEAGAYANTLKGRARPIRMRWNHWGPVIGKWIELVEDKKGLLVSGELTPGHSQAADVYASMKHGAVDGLSIGYRVKAFDQLNDDRRILKEIELVEISIVEEPADLGAKIGDVKSFIEAAESLKEIESILRDAGGFNRIDAKALVSRIKSMSLRDVETEGNVKAGIASVFSGFKLS